MDFCHVIVLVLKGTNVCPGLVDSLELDAKD